MRSQKGRSDFLAWILYFAVFMNGFEAAMAIRSSKHPDAASIPIIAMSADAYDEDVARSLKSGMNSHIAKPVDPHKIYAEVARLCAAREKRAAN